MQQPMTHLSTNNSPTHPEFVRVVCPYPVLAAGLTSTLEKAGIRHGNRPPSEDVPYCVLLCACEAEDLPETLRHVRQESPEALIVVFGLRNDPLLAHTALKASARGFVHAEMTPKQIARALEVVLKGEIVAPRELLPFLLAYEDSLGDLLELLSRRQRETLELAAEGLTNVQIAQRLYLAVPTVKNHLSAAYRLLGVKTRAEASRLVRRAQRQTSLDIKPSASRTEENL